MQPHRVSLADGNNLRDGIDARRAKAVRGVVLKSEELSLDDWLGALARDLAEEAQTNERAQVALQELLSG